jgi:hypothetical protein
MLSLRVRRWYLDLGLENLVIYDLFLMCWVRGDIGFNF